ncbi:MAG TPA: cytochrome c oxidase assembly protein [Candidatus Dormibacteraeota bacterium]|nr:cytochrome c oxidase assembly protein [Candidatus Dormibacteraeota bacterium]
MARRHRAALAVGSLLFAAALLAPLSQLPQERLSLHMLEEMLVLAVVIPLLAYGVSPLLAGRAVSRVHPVAGIVTLNLVLFASQLPAVVDLGSKDPGFREAIQAVFMMGAFLFWWPVVRRDGLSPVAKIGYLMVAGVPPTIPGITLALSHHLFYQAYRSIDDQQLAGLLLFGTAKFALVAGTFVVLWRILTPQPEPPDRDDGPSPAGDLPPSAPAWLWRLEEELPAEAGRPTRPVPSGAKVRSAI